MGFDKGYGELAIIMANMSKQKKGEGAGFSWIIAIIVLILSAGVILWVLQASAAKADEKTKVDLCRVSNEIRVGVEHRTSEYVSTPRFCDTVDKTSGKAMVPTKNYPQEDKGVTKEVRDMVKNCWYMWLEGSEPNIFRLFPGKQSCAMCYKFKVKDKVKFKPADLVQALNQPYFASDTSDKCNPPNGGTWKTSCSPDESSVKSRDIAPKECCRKDLINECDNKGGQCSESPSSPYEFEYAKWACPSGKTCYVEPDNMVTYMEYIVESNTIEGKPAGDFYIEGMGDMDFADLISMEYPIDKKYAISFISPSEDCGWLGKKCWGIAIDAWVYGRAPGAIKTWGRHKLESDEPDFKPSNLLLSTYETAQKMGCSED